MSIPLPTDWRTLRVRVPASTSNLGSGFDQLGLALDLFLEARLERGTGPLEIRSPVGWPDPENDRLLEALGRSLGSKPRGRLSIASEIPIGRGIGSSGAAIGAGLLLGSALGGDLDPDRARLLALGIELEGHPDNIGAALLGGAIASLPLGPNAAAWTRLELSPSIGFALAWPQEPLFTPAARAVLPTTLSLEDAVFNARRLTLLLSGLASGDPRSLELGLQDRWHVPFRLPLLPGAQAAIEAARAAGAYGATLSGAGSAVLALCPLDLAHVVAARMAERLELATGKGTGRVSRPVHGQPRVEVLE